MLFLLISSTILVFIFYYHYKKVSRLPPGPISLPIIGNIPEITYHLWRTKSIVETLNIFKKKYGDVFTLWFGPLPHVNICDYDIAHEVFVKNGSKYADRQLPSIMEHDRNGFGVLFSNGHIWQEMRRFSLHTLRNMGVGKDLMEERIMDEVNARCIEIDEKSKNGVTVVPSNEFFDITVGSIINNILIGRRYEEDNKHEFIELKKLFEEGAKNFNPFVLATPVSILKPFFNSRYTNMKGLMDKLRSFLSKHAIKRVEDYKTGAVTINPEDPQDFVDAFILKMEKEPENPAYSVVALQNILMDLWIAGQETTSTTLIGAFNQFLNHPKVMSNVRDELLKVTNGGSRSLSLKDKNETPYLNATIAEVQRHASILNMNFWRINHEFTTVGGHPVDSGAFLSAQLSVMHTDEKVYSSPTKFDPSRFLNDDRMIQQLIPFGIGKRSCLGESMARAELYLIIGNLLLRYDFRANGKLPDTSDQLPFSMTKKPFISMIEFVKLNIR